MIGSSNNAAPAVASDRGLRVASTCSHTAGRELVVAGFDASNDGAASHTHSDGSVHEGRDIVLTGDNVVNLTGAETRWGTDGSTPASGMASWAERFAAEVTGAAQGWSAAQRGYWNPQDTTFHSDSGGGSSTAEGDTFVGDTFTVNGETFVEPGDPVAGAAYADAVIQRLKAQGIL